MDIRYPSFINFEKVYKNENKYSSTERRNYQAQFNH